MAEEGSEILVDKRIAEGLLAVADESTPSISNTTTSNETSLNTPRKPRFIPRLRQGFRNLLHRPSSDGDNSLSGAAVSSETAEKEPLFGSNLYKDAEGGIGSVPKVEPPPQSTPTLNSEPLPTTASGLSESVMQQANIKARQEGKPLPYPEAQGVKLPYALEGKLLDLKGERDVLIQKLSDLMISDAERAEFEAQIATLDGQINQFMFPTPEERKQQVEETKKELTDIRAANEDLEPSYKEDLNNQIDSFISELDNYIKDIPEAADAERSILRRVLDYKLPLVGATVKDYLIYTAVGSSTGLVARTAVLNGMRIFLSVGATPVATTLAGAAAGGASGFAREYIKLVRDEKRQEKISELREKYNDRNTLKRELLVRLKSGDLQRLGKASLRGAIVGAMSGFVAFEVASWAKDHIDLNSFIEGIKHHLPGGGTDRGSTLSVKPEPTPTPWHSPSPHETPINSSAGVHSTSTPIATETPTPTPTHPLPNSSPLELSSTPTVHSTPAVNLPPGHSGTNIDLGNHGASGTGPGSTGLEPKPGSNLSVGSSHGSTLGVSADKANGSFGTHSAPVGETAFHIPDGVIPKDGIVHLSEGSNPWNMASKIGEHALGRPLTPEETLELTKEIARQSKVAVPGWGIGGPGFTDEHSLGTGYKLVFNDKVVSLLQSFKK